MKRKTINLNIEPLIRLCMATDKCICAVEWNYVWKEKHKMVK